MHILSAHCLTQNFSNKKTSLESFYSIASKQFIKIMGLFSTKYPVSALARHLGIELGDFSRIITVCSWEKKSNCQRPWRFAKLLTWRPRRRSRTPLPQLGRSKVFWNVQYWFMFNFYFIRVIMVGEYVKVLDFLRKFYFNKF